MSDHMLSNARFFIHHKSNSFEPIPKLNFAWYVHGDFKAPKMFKWLTPDFLLGESTSPWSTNQPPIVLASFSYDKEIFVFTEFKIRTRITPNTDTFDAVYIISLAFQEK